MTDHIDTAQERKKLAGLTGFTPGPWYAGQPEHANGWWIVATDPEHFDCIDGSGDGGFYEQEARLIAAAPDLLATVHRLLDALDAMQARTEKAEAGRDQALARLAAAYEATAVATELAWHDPESEESPAFQVSVIRNLTPADAEAALQRVVDAAWNDAIEAAARVQETAYRRGVLGEKHADIIRALKRPGASHE